jgi:hypothetical protein
VAQAAPASNTTKPVSLASGLDDTPPFVNRPKPEQYPQPLSIGYATNENGWKVPYGGAKYDPDAKKKAIEAAYEAKKKEENTMQPQAAPDGFYNKRIDGAWTGLAQGDDKPTMNMDGFYDRKIDGSWTGLAQGDVMPSSDKDGFYNRKIDGVWTSLAQGLDDKPPTVDLPKPEQYPLPIDIHQATNDNGYKIPWHSFTYDPYAKP